MRVLLASARLLLPDTMGSGALRRGLRGGVHGGALLLDAYSSSADVDAVVTAFVLAATRALVSAGSIGRTESSAMGSVRACGENEGARVRDQQDLSQHQCGAAEQAAATG